MGINTTIMNEQETKLERARKKVKEIKDWYAHLVVYIVVCTLYVLFNSGVFDGGKVSGYIPWWSSLTMPIGWGIGILCHWFYAFKGGNFKQRLKNWEERKIQEYLDDERSESSKFNEK